ncbi:DUF4861 domain-containing protein [Maribellus sp. YY47]|uniref:DUF4861 domain-containing protein n=1 Tax=Maribellus sp. YY47 TaxID=2929486 RepID=UPI0020008FDF|nr:DUF4861 domain-containing protein [Maribellus sp. YY47]MCK3684466.1 DUF4861 domain-containing protein [Maribellus sp. YY47]
MKTKASVVLIAVVALFACKQEHYVSFKNSIPEDRSDEVVILTREQVAEKVEIKEGFLPIFRVGEETLPSQVDDMNGDGQWDEIAVLLSFKANEEKKAVLEMVPEAEYPSFEKRTNVRLGIHQQDGSYKEFDHYTAIPYTEPFKIIAQGESVSWENDKIAFRVYFDCRNVKDLFGKLKPGMIIDKIHTPEIKDYHKLNDWGMDVLHCGSSLGSGGIALMKNDSLYRLGSTDNYEYQKITEGPVRSVFDLIYKGWHVDGENLEAVERISIYPGKYWFQSEVTVKGLPEGAEVVTGMVTSLLKREPFEFQADDFQCIGTHDVQSLNNDELGMAVLVPKAEAGKIGRTTDIDFFKLGYQTVVEKGFSNIISETYYIAQKAENNQPARHYFAAVWGLDKEQWKTEEGFKAYLKEEAKSLSSPIEVQL